MSHETMFAAALSDAGGKAPPSVTRRDGGDATRRFGVYRNNVAHGLVLALGSIFPAVKAQCGDARFSDAARLYLAAHPPRSRLVFELGADFAGFLDGFAPARANALARRSRAAGARLARRLSRSGYRTA